MAIYPELAKLVAEGRDAEARRIVVRTAIIATAATLPMYLAVIFFGRQIMTLLFGPGFDAGYLSLVFLISAAGLYAIAFAFSLYVQLRRGAATLLAINVASFVLFGASTLTLLPLLGPSVAGIGTFLFCAAFGALSIYFGLISPGPATPHPASRDEQEAMAGANDVKILAGDR